MNFGLAVAVVASMGGVAVGVLMAVMNRRGRQWARITQTVLSSIGLVYMLVVLANGTLISSYGQDVVLGVVWAFAAVLLEIAIIVLLWRPRTRAWFHTLSERGNASRAVPEIRPT